jgi:hypothetical protein
VKASRWRSLAIYVGLASETPAERQQRESDTAAESILHMAFASLFAAVVAGAFWAAAAMDSTLGAVGFGAAIGAFLFVRDLWERRRAVRRAHDQSQ